MNRQEQLEYLASLNELPTELDEFFMWAADEDVGPTLEGLLKEFRQRHEVVTEDDRQSIAISEEGRLVSYTMFDKYQHAEEYTSPGLGAIAVRMLRIPYAIAINRLPEFEGDQIYEGCMFAPKWAPADPSQFVAICMTKKFLDSRADGKWGWANIDIGTRSKLGEVVMKHAKTNEDVERWWFFAQTWCGEDDTFPA